MRMALPRAVTFALLASPTACRAPHRIEAATGDTVIVNDSGAARLPIHAVDAKGERLAKPSLHYAMLEGAGLSVSGDTVYCHGTGEGRVRVTSGRALRDLTVLCRPFLALSFPTLFTGPLELTLGMAPQPFAVAAVDRNRRPVRDLVFGLEILDTSVVTTRKGWLFARRAGRTFVRVHVGRCMLDLPVTVREAGNAEVPPPAETPPPIDHGRMCPVLLPME